MDDSRDTFQVISRGLSDLPSCEKVKTKVFYDPSSMEVFIATVQDSSEIRISKIRFLCSNNNLVPAPADVVQNLCGFPVDTLPPLGHCLAPKVSSCTIAFDERLINDCQELKLLMMGSAGHPYWKSLLAAELVVRLQEIGEVMIAGGITYDDNRHEGSDKRVWEVSSSDKDEKKIPTTPSRTPSNSLDPFYPKPYFPIDGPSLNIARLVIRQKEISNPLTPVFLTVMGRIGTINVRTKRSLRCEFLPTVREMSRNDETNDNEVSHPWRSAVSGKDMAVDLIFGKFFLQSYGTKLGEALIEEVQEGQLVQIEAKTNPGQRESIEKWIDTNCLELVPMNCQLLSCGSRSYGDSFDKGGLQTGRKPKKTGSSSSLPTLTLSDIYQGNSSIKFVDDARSISEFSSDIAKLLSEVGDRPSLSPYVGIDCEWQPREFMEDKKQPQPVLLLQVSLHALERVYILDLQALLRPLEESDTPFNQLEGELSECLSKLMKSNRFIKVGYQLSSDLRRIFASYPHLPCFQEVHSILEISSFIKRVLRISKQKKSRYITMSLAAMTSHYLGMALDKEHQMTDWAVRDLTPRQLEYAALDAAVPPRLLEEALESIGASFSDEGPRGTEVSSCPVPRRHEGDAALEGEVASVRFHRLSGDTDEETAGELGAKRIVGPSWILSSVWKAVEAPPPPLVVPSSSRR
ncbi:unnamed protein product [Pseudo-nitzschia multistriata]|nr:unnamed protein product [Pseudo-nitzschia multistriata]